MDIHDTDVCLQIWDTAGQERFHQGSLGSSFYKGAHGALLVYDVNNEKSIEQIAQWRDECLNHVDEDIDFPVVVVGNKVDLRDATNESERIDQSLVKHWCADNSYGHIETSAKEGVGVEAAMGAIAALAVEVQKSPIAVKKRTASVVNKKIKLDQLYQKKSSSYCEGCI